MHNKNLQFVQLIISAGMLKIKRVVAAPGWGNDNSPFSLYLIV